MSQDPAPVFATQPQRQEVETVLAAGLFDPHSNLGRLLRYLCEKHFEGRQEEIKEYNIAIDVFGRPADFDKRRDSIVRVEASRLRKRLEEYYQGDGQTHEVRIVIPAGQYAPQFVENRPLLRVVRPGDAPAVTRRRAPTWLRWLAPGLAVAALAAWVTVREWPRKAQTPDAGKTQSAQPVPAAAEDSDGAIRILCGYTKGRFVDRQGRVWLGDRYYKGGAATEGQAGFVSRTQDATIFRSMRSVSSFSYDIPLKPGVYELRLYFAETFFGPSLLNEGAEGTRMMEIMLNGKPLLRNFDVYADAGGSHIADVRTFKDVSPAEDGYLHLGFNPIINTPFVNAIEIVPGVRGRIRPIRIAARDSSYTDHTGAVWAPDNYFQGGRLMSHTQFQPEGPDADFFQSERFGNFSYAIPVPPGRYAVTLRFAETFFGAVPECENCGAGSRVFDVYSNGKVLLKDFDIFKEAGGPKKPVAKTLHGLEPNAQGKLLLEFKPVKNYACVNGIEVVDESPL